MNVMKKQIKSLFTDTQKAIYSGLWLSGYEKEGEYQEWYDLTQVYMYCIYRDGELNGDFKTWAALGKLSRHNVYKDGKIVEKFK